MSDTIDTPEYILKMAIALGERDYTFVGNLAYEALGRYAKLLERSAGVWVPCSERLPIEEDEDCVVVIDNDGTPAIDILAYFSGEFYTTYGKVTHWLDVKPPGGK